MSNKVYYYYEIKHRSKLKDGRILINSTPLSIVHEGKEKTLVFREEHQAFEFLDRMNMVKEYRPAKISFYEPISELDRDVYLPYIDLGTGFREFIDQLQPESNIYIERRDTVITNE